MWLRLWISLRAYFSGFGVLIYPWIASLLTGMTGFILQHGFGVDPNRFGMHIVLPICFVAAMVLPFFIFHRAHQETVALKARVADLERRRTKIDPDPVYVGNMRGWAIRVHNESTTSALVAAEIVAADPSFTNP